MAAGIYEVNLELQLTGSDVFDDSDGISVSADDGESAVAKAKAHFLSMAYDEETAAELNAGDPHPTIKAGDKCYSAARLASLKLSAAAQI